MPRVVEQKRESVVADSFTEVATMARKPCGMPVKDIKSEIRKRFGSLSGVSDQIGMARNGISNILSQPGYSISGEQKVAKLLGREPYEIWPDRYHADGTPVSRVVDRQPTNSVPADLPQNGVAA